MAERYCVPSSGPWRLSCVGSCATEKKIIRIWPYEICEGSNVMLTGFGMAGEAAADHFVAGRIDAAAGIACGHGADAFEVLEDSLHAPEAAARQDCRLMRFGCRE